MAAGFKGLFRAILIISLAFSAGRPALARAADPSLCPLNMPAPESLDPVFMIGSASGNSYYDDFRDQLLLCGWPEDKLRTFELRAAGCMGEEVADIAGRAEEARRELGAEHVDLLGYSLGGVRARAYLALFEGWRHARNVVLWGTPNLGLPYMGSDEEWCQEVFFTSDWMACLSGLSSNPACESPFRAIAPLSVCATSAEEGIVYYNFFSDDAFCGFCFLFGGGVYPYSDGVVPAEFVEMPGVYNLHMPDLEHWDWFMLDAAPEVFRVSMLGLLGREPPGYEDGDGVPEAADNCPFAANADQADADSDGVGDACDPCPGFYGGDADCDGVCPPADNCPAEPNADQRDLDGDGEGDACDPDCDGDGYEGPHGDERDCDDMRPDAHPGAPEVCNGADDDCDGAPDQGLDCDGDGYAAPEDCDDGDPGVHPGAEEVAGNGVDDDCDGAVDELTPSCAPVAPRGGIR